jgi:uncharacterized Zn finger protein (UPF0148 family)
MDLLAQLERGSLYLSEMGSKNMHRCPQCKKILFKTKKGQLVCPNGCKQHTKRTAFNTVVDPLKDRRGEDDKDPWNKVRF